MRLLTAIIRKLPSALLIVVWGLAAGPALAEVMPQSDDGLSVAERVEVDRLLATAQYSSQGCIPATVIVDTTRKVACFGMYRLSQSTGEARQMFYRTIEWALDSVAPAEAHVYLATYNGTLDPNNHDGDGQAAYDFLINGVGIPAANIDYGHQTTLETDDFSDYDLVVYANSYPRDVQNVLSYDVGYVTTSVRQTAQLNIGTGDLLLHQDRDSVYVTDNMHPITTGLTPGLLVLPDSMWMDATYASNNGMALVATHESCYFPPVEIRAHQAWTYELGSVDTLFIELLDYRSWLAMGGFDILLQYDPEIMIEILDVLPGSIATECGWESIDWNVGTAADCGGDPCPDDMIRLTGVADVANVPGEPDCLVDSNGTLARVVFRYTSDSAMFNVPGHVKFVWYDCGDNTISNDGGDTLSISNEVRSTEGVVLTADSAMPTIHGAPAICESSNAVLRRVDFRNGWVAAYRPWDPQLNRGDVNLNNLAYEIADAILFARALTYGVDEFTIDYDGQVAATDCNADGFFLTLEDYVYLWRVIVGDVLPPARAADTVWFEQDTLARVVRMNYPDSVKAVLLVFAGDLEPWGWDDSTRPYDGLYTRVLMDVYLMEPDVFDADSLFHYTGEGELVAAYATYDGLSPLPTDIVGTGESCCLSRGNIDGDPDGSVNIADLIYLVEYVFLGGPEPPCATEADVLPDLHVDIADLAHLVNYMFLYGSPLAPCD